MLKMCTAASYFGIALAGWQAAALPSLHASSPQQGAQVFVDAGCVQCHGMSGMGTTKGPSLRDVRKRLTAEQTHRQIKDGGKSMPPFGDALTEEQIDQLVEFLRSRSAWKQPLPAATAERSPEAAPGSETGNWIQ